MKLKISQLNPNPFKKEINNGKLREEVIDKIRSNIKELGLMGSLPVIEKNGKYYLIAGHHRTEALRREFGKDFEVEVTVHNYSEDNVLRGMVVENLTQRMDELSEVTENLNVVRNYLKKQKKCSPGEQKARIPGSIRDIYNWLNKNGEVMSVVKIEEYLQIYDNLDKNLLKKATKTFGGIKEEDTISISEAKMLSKLEREEQKPMQKILEKTGLDRNKKKILVTKYLHAPKEEKEMILQEKKDIKLVGIGGAGNSVVTPLTIEERLIKVQDALFKVQVEMENLKDFVDGTNNVYVHTKSLEKMGLFIKSFVDNSLTPFTKKIILKLGDKMKGGIYWKLEK